MSAVPITVAVPHHSGYGHTARQAAAAAVAEGVGAMAQSPSDLGPEQAPGASDLRTARRLGERVARAALRQALGREAESVLVVTA
ncbi:hypothetical protein ACF05T_02870 [Streptomyces lateritius]|uniref:Uncharacterized protein n=1 Tax=Streptomyces lateritius TaxID=67313 RepID=A0ABW6Y5U5_9ACTN